MEATLTTVDTLKIYQPKNGYRFSVEPFILTKNIKIRDNQCIVDLGSGCGIIAILASKLNPKCKVFAVEKNIEMIELIEENIKLHSLFNITIITDLKFIDTNQVDIIISNPPYFIKGSYRDSHRFFNEKFETESMEETLTSLRRIIKNKGLLRISHHPTRIVDIVKMLDNLGFGIKTITPVYGSRNKTASFIIIDSKFNTKSHTVIDKAIYLG